MSHARRGLHLTRRAATPIALRVSRPDGRSGKDRKVAGEESPGSMDMRCRITSGEAGPRASGERPQGKCHRERTAAAFLAERARQGWKGAV